MKIQLSSTLPFTPVQLDSRHAVPRRAVGQLHGSDGTREYQTAVYEFRHGEQDQIHYQIDPQERVYLDEKADKSAASSSQTVAAALEWVSDDESLTYKPYAFLVMNAMSKLVGAWDGVVYQTPSGERLHDTLGDATLQVVDACVCNESGLWAQVNMTAEEAGSPVGSDAVISRQSGWVPLHAAVN
ncbi:hypothetical protein [Granulosicoccus antarcticus]|uniref:Uncharacterized protein n=1 Tax=Granulosicoccus antarcticus IMCC3135 TaxID=1192854 RepID=A0A2Z2NS36_9GAMM|nr:hypothetical protein [Granulosicoccus antarcticus]ASJ71550.1 hypothetical protein IMCC3135_07220 [Granulosicoccus antarcticus IMCC3135]